MNKLKQYLDTKKYQTRIHYKRGFDLLKKYMETQGLDFSPEGLISQEAQDLRKPVEDREYPGVTLINSFIKYLEKEGRAPNSIHVIIAGIRDFFDYYGVPLQKKRLRAPKAKPRKINRKIIIGKEEVRILVDHCTSNRDKALILCLWQSGMSIGDLLNLNISDVLDREPKTGNLDDPPLLLSVRRKKTGNDYHTCFGRDSCKAIKRYLDERKRKYDCPLQYDDPLFIELRKDNGQYKRMTVSSADKVFMRITERSGIVSKERLEKADINPARPHSLRMGFASTLSYAGCNSTLIEYMMGHQSRYNGAYFDGNGKKVREEYMKHEKVLTIEKGPVETELITQKLSSLEMEHRLLTRIIKYLAKDWWDGYDLEDPEATAELFTCFYGEDEKISDKEIESFIDMFAGPLPKSPQKLEPPPPIKIDIDEDL